MFTVWNPERWYRLNSDISTLLTRRQPAPAPRLDVYIGGGAIVWSQVVVPDGLQVTDERAESAPVKPVGGGLICGDVFDMSTGKPIAGAEITLIMIGEGKWVGQLPRGRASSLGSFRIERVPKGVYAIAVEAEGYASRRLEESYYNRGNAYYQVAGTLVRPASISGMVTDMEGRPIQGASVVVTDAYGLDGEDYRSADIPGRVEKWVPGEIWQAVTDGQGQFEIGALPTGFVQVRCRVPGMHLAKSSREICKVPGEPIILTMEGTGTIRGKVVDKGGKPPSEPVTVSISTVGGERIGTWGGSLLCAEDGSFAFTEVPPGEYYVTSDPGLLLDGRDPHAARVTVEVGKTIELTIVHGDR
jgi:protocatechuate 3,4-dioxygenase beta subunit